MTEVVRTRIAPAPSGSIHVGTAHTALYNWLYTRHHNGVFVLRIEDTDVKRVTQEAVDSALEDLRWLGLDWDEGPEVGGEFGPYRQSERFERYDAVAAQMLDRGEAYRCYCTANELEERRRKALAEGKPPGYDGFCRDLSGDQERAFQAAGRSFAVRFKVPEHRTISFEDKVRGTISTATSQIPDFIIKRSDGSATYMLATTVDDVLMNITHIIRGEDLIAATPRQLLMREAMAAHDVPVFAHLALLVDERGRKLSKRWGDVAVSAYRERGFTPEAMVNYMALLGWSFDDRTNIFSRDELIEKFSLDRVGRNPSAFDVNKLEWLNQHYIKEMPAAELAHRMQSFCVSSGVDAGGDKGLEVLEKVAPLLSERLKRLDEAPPMVAFLFGEPEPDDKARKALEGQGEYLNAVAAALDGLEKWTSPSIEEALRALAAERELKPKNAFQPVRAAVMGTLISPPLFESLEILGREPTLSRLRVAAGEAA